MSGDSLEMVRLANSVPIGSRWRHLNTGDVWMVVARHGGRLDLSRDPNEVPRWVWPDYLTDPHNFEALR